MLISTDLNKLEKEGFIMGDIVRELKVSELNRILPMVRKTIEKERRLDELEGIQYENEAVLEKIKQIISTLESIPKVLEFSIALKNLLVGWKNDSEIDTQNKRKNELIELINTYNAEINELTNQLEFEIDFYRSITSVIATDGGFLSSEEIQIEFIPEYLYLLVIDTSFGKKFTLRRFIKEDSMDSFLELIRTNISNPHANDIADALEHGKFDPQMYFQLF